MSAGPFQSKPGVPIASDAGGDVRVTSALLVGIGVGGLGVAVKSAPPEEGSSVESGGGVGVHAGEGVRVEGG